MIKQSILYLALSILIILFAAHVKFVFVYVNILYLHINQFIEPLFGTGFVGELFRDLFTLILTPLTIAAIPAGIYWLIKRKKMPHFIELTWFFWLVLAMSSYLIH